MQFIHLHLSLDYKEGKDYIWENPGFIIEMSTGKAPAESTISLKEV